MLRKVISSLSVVAAICTATFYASAAAPSASTAASQAAPGEQLSQVELLKAQLEVTRTYHSSLLDTVYWALGTVFVMVTLLVGFGWFANFRVYERDKDVLRRELEAENEKNKKKLETFLDQRLVQVSADVETAQAQRMETLEALNTVLSRRLNDHLAMLERERIRQTIKLSPSASYSLESALRLLEKCIDQSPDEIPDVLHLILKKLDEGGKFTARAITDVNSALDKLPQQYKTLSDKLRTKLVASDIF